MNEKQIRAYVKKLHRFYRDLFSYSLINLVLIAIWWMSGRGYFWPIWVLVGWGLSLGVQACSFGLTLRLQSLIPFLRPDWEEREVQRLLKSSKY